MRFISLFIFLLPFFLSCSNSRKDYMGEILSFEPDSVYYQALEAGTEPVFLKSPEFDVSSKDSQWTLSKKNSLSFGFTDKDIWLAIRAKNNSSENQIVLEFGNPHIDEVLLFEPGNTDPFKRAGDLIPHSEWDLYSKSVAVLLSWKPQTEKLIYVKISTTSAIYLALKLHTKNGFDLKENKENSVIGFFYGTIVIMVIYNLFIYFILKDHSYILYSFSILANLLVQCFLNGISNDLFTPDEPMIHNRIGSVFVCLSAMFSWTFALQFLNCKKYVPKADLILKILISLVLIYLVLVINLLPLRTMVRLTQIVAQIFVGSVFVVAYLSLKAGNKQAKLFLIGWSILLGGILLFTFMQSGLVPSNWVTVYSNQIGSTLEAGILSLALADKINQLKEEKAEAQAGALANLEEKVFARTKELDESLQIIRKDLNVAKKIQQNLFSPPKLHDKRLEFETYYKSMSEVGGDFYDVSQIDKDRFRFCVADATGHGIQAALITMAIKSEYESLKAVHDSPNELLSHLNRIFFHKYSMLQTIFTCCVCDLDFKSGKLIFASAGHPDQIIIKQGEIHNLSRTGKILGMVSNSVYSTVEFGIEEKDRIFLFSDGLFEQFDHRREIFGEDRLRDFLSAKSNSPLSECLLHANYKIDQFVGSQSRQDDVTFIACEIKKYAS